MHIFLTTLLLLLELLVAASGRNTFKVVPFFAVLVFVENCSCGITSTAHFAISTVPFFKEITENALEGRKAPVVVIFFCSDFSTGTYANRLWIVRYPCESARKLIDF